MTSAKFFLFISVFSVSCGGGGEGKLSSFDGSSSDGSAVGFADSMRSDLKSYDGTERTDTVPHDSAPASVDVLSSATDGPRKQGSIEIASSADLACLWEADHEHRPDYTSRPSLPGSRCEGTVTTALNVRLTYDGGCFHGLCVVTPPEDLSPECSNVARDASGNLTHVMRMYEGKTLTGGRGQCWNGKLCSGFFNPKTMVCE